MDAVISIFNAAKVPLEYEVVEMGKWVFDKGFNNGMTTEAQEVIEELGILFKGIWKRQKEKV
jgi:isocitrate dehydrogenase